MNPCVIFENYVAHFLLEDGLSINTESEVALSISEYLVSVYLYNEVEVISWITLTVLLYPGVTSEKSFNEVGPTFNSGTFGYTQEDSVDTLLL